MNAEGQSVDHRILKGSANIDYTEWRTVSELGK